MSLEENIIIAVDFGTSNTIICTNDNTYLHDEQSGKYCIPSSISISRLHDKNHIMYGSASHESDDVSYKHFMEFKRYITSDKHDDDMENAICLWWKYIKSRTNATHVIVTVPVSWTQHHRKRYRDIIESSTDIKVLDMYDEPIAAMAYHYGPHATLTHDVIVYDMGAGTLDISCICHKTGCVQTSGNSHFGGTNLVYALYEKIIDTYPHLTSWLDKIPIRRKRLFLECEENLIRGGDVDIWFPHDDTTFKMSRNALLSYMQYRFRDIMIEPLRNVVSQQSYDIIFVGGPCQSSWIRDIILSSYQFRVATKSDMLISVCGGAWALWKHDNHNNDNGDADISFLWKPTLRDNIGLRAKDGLFVPLIYAGSELPAYGESKFTTYEDDMDEVDIDIYRGNHFVCDGNTKIYHTTKHIPSASRGVVKINIRVDVDEHENVSVICEI